MDESLWRLDGRVLARRSCQGQDYVFDDGPRPATIAPVDSHPLASTTEDRYRAMVEHSSDLMALVGREGTILYASRSVERILGYPASEYVGRRLFSFIHPDDCSRAEAHFEECLRLPGVPVATEWRHQHRGGAWRCLEGVTVNRIDEPGVAAIVTSWRDVTDRRLAERALQESEERYRIVTAHASDLIVLVDLRGRIIYASPSHQAILGHSPEALSGDSIETIVHPDDHHGLLTAFQDVVSSAESRRVELRLVRVSGDLIEVDAILSPIMPAGVTVDRILVSGRDITERKHAERALRRSEQQFRAVFDSAVIGIARLDAAGRFVDGNHGLVNMCGCTVEELGGRAFADLLHPEERQAGIADFRDLMDGRRDHYQVERRYCRKDGSFAWANVTMSVVRGQEGGPPFCIAMLENISERKQAEEALRQSHKRLTRWVTELEQRTREISLLSEMGELLQACRSPEEAYGVITRMARQLFPLEHGALGVLTDSPRVVEAVATWGVPVGERLFAPDECWALRRGRVHLVEDIQLGLICRHLHRPLSGPYVCIPMMAQGESIGLLTLTLPEADRSSAARQLAQTVAEHVALSLANLRLQQTLRMQSIRDPLTGLFNRRYMEESLVRETRRATRGRHPVGIIMLDLDHFKGINDRYGHEAGDLLLREVGAVLLRSVRGEDIACRYGGEEFTLILPEAGLSDAAQRAEQIRLAVKNLNVQYRRQALGSITASLGVAVYPDHGPTGEAVLAAADVALYEAKAQGRDRVAAIGRSA